MSLILVRNQKQINSKSMETKQLQLVTYEQAKKLKELGFDWSVDYHYNASVQRLFRNIQQDNYNDDDVFHSAPTVALALKWIRGKKALNYRIQFNEGGSASYCRNITNLHRQWTYACYEAAESALLDELLTILEREK
jgi:hypothetical protein